MGVGEAGLPGARGLRAELGGQRNFGDVDTSVASRGKKPRKQKILGRGSDLQEPHVAPPESPW